MSYPEAIEGEILSCLRSKKYHACELEQMRARRTKKGMVMKFFYKNERSPSIIPSTQIKDRAGTIHDHWRFLSQKKGGKQ